MEKKDLILPKSKQSNGLNTIRYDKFIEHFNNLSLTYNYFDLLTKRNKKNDRHSIIDIKKFRSIFDDNSYSFLDLMFFFVVANKSQVINIINFLISDHNYYGQFNVEKYGGQYDIKFDSLEHNIVNRQLFILSSLSLIKDYFVICNKNKEDKDSKEQLLTNLIEDIFLDDYGLINNFKKIEKLKINTIIEEKMEKIFNKNQEINVDINKTKEKILNYYEGFLLDETISKKDRVKYFVNWCDNELIFNFNKTKIEYDITYDELSSGKTMEIELNDMQNQQQFYQNLTNAFNEINEVSHQISSMPFLGK